MLPYKIEIGFVKINMEMSEWIRFLMCLFLSFRLQCQHFKCGQAGGDGASAARSSGREEEPPGTQGYYEIKL